MPSIRELVAHCLEAISMLSFDIKGRLRTRIEQSENSSILNYIE